MSNLLTEAQRLEFTQINISSHEIIKHYTFSAFDIENIKKHRKDYNQLGFAVTLALLRTPKWINNIPNNILYYIAKQVEVIPEKVELYSENTKLKHLREIKQVYGLKHYTEQDGMFLLETLILCALENDNVMNLMKLAIYEIKKQKIILPGITTIEKIVENSILIAEKQIIQLINSNLEEQHKLKLDMLINIKYNNKTVFSWLKERTGFSSPKVFMETIKKSNFICDLGIKIDISKLHPNRIRQFSRLASKYESFTLRRFKPQKRYMILAIFLYELQQTLIDKLVEIHDKQINFTFSKARKKQDEIQNQNGKLINEKIVHLATIGSILIKSKEQDLNPFELLESFMPWNLLIKSFEEARKLVKPITYDYIDLIKYKQLRRYTPSLIKYLKFNATNNSSKLLLEALKILNISNQNNKRKISEDAPIEFIPNRWKKYLYDKDGFISKKYYEIATLSELKNRIRSGDISVEGSRNFKNFEQYLITDNQWKTIKITNTRLAVSLDLQEFLQERFFTLDKKLKYFSKILNKLENIEIHNSKIHVDRLKKDIHPEALVLSKKLYNIIPKIKLPELLLEVSSWTNFDKNFIHASTGHVTNKQEKKILLAALMALGTNIGLSKMASSTSDISYKQMAYSAQWRLYDDTLKKAQATLVNFHKNLFLSSFWGDGSTSSSDGMRVQIGVSSLYSDFNPHYGYSKGSTMYRFVSDQFSTFYTKVISTNVRDALYVIDGLLYHETELNIQEHYTDTAGYTDHVFALSHLLGFRFAPRIRDISELRLYSIDKISNYPKIANLLSEKINIKIIQDNFDNILKLAHCIREGIVTSSLIMNKLGSYAKQNSLATALRELGKIEKTIFVLDYLTDKNFRRSVQRGLNKGEAMNALARAIFFGKLGELRERELQDQLQQASALSILINAISIWNTVYLEKAVNYLKQIDNFDESLLKHISPLNWQHINLLGEYHFDIEDIPDFKTLRPLTLKDI